MREISSKELSKEAFAKFGTYSDMLSPEGVHLGNYPCEFFRDQTSMNISSKIVGFSVMQISKREMVIQELEHHDYTCEALMPMDGDVYLHVGPATGKDTVPYDEIEAFRIPKGTMVTLKPGVWHSGAFSADREQVKILVVLPERCYATDCTIVPIPEDDFIKII